MEIIGIISEYNPFHTGHLYHINQTKKHFPDSILVALMSGYFVQRGEPAMLSKWDRAKVAVMNGVNLVIELPTLFATSAAPDFAGGAMTLLKKIGATRFSFGSEIEDLETLKNLAAHTQSEGFRTDLKKNLDQGHSYAAASIRAGAPMLPNAILAVEYLKYAGDLKPILIPRNSNHSDTNLYPTNPEMKSGKIPFFSSAKAIRNALQTRYHFDVNPTTLQTLTGIDYTCIGMSSASCIGVPASSPISSSDSLPTWNSLSPKILDALLLYRIRSMGAEELKHTRGMAEGFENRLKEAASLATTTEQLLSLAETRRFPRAKIRRILMSVLLQISAENPVILKNSGILTDTGADTLKNPDIFENIDYIRVLALDEKGRKLLSRLKEKPQSEWRSEWRSQQGQRPEIITKLSKSQHKSPLLELDKRASSVYATLTGVSDSEYRILPYIHS